MCSASYAVKPDSESWARTQVSDRTHSLCPRMPGDGLLAVYKPLLFLLSPSALLLFELLQGPGTGW